MHPEEIYTTSLIFTVTGERATFPYQFFPHDNITKIFEKKVRPTDLFDGESAINTVDSIFYLRLGNTITATPIGSSGSTITVADTATIKLSLSLTGELTADIIDGVFAPALTSEEHYVTTMEKAVLHSHTNKSDLDLVSGTNTGNQVGDNESITGAGSNADPFRTLTTRLQKATRSTGLNWGGYLVVAESMLTDRFDVGEGEGFIVDNYTDPSNPTYTVVSWDNMYDVETPLLHTAATTYIGVDIDGHLIFRPDVFTPEERRDYIFLGWVDHPDNTIIIFTLTEPYWNADIQAQMNDFFDAFGAFNIYGNDYNAATGLNIQKTEGKIFDNSANFTVSRKNPHIIINPQENPCEIYYYYRDGVGGWVNDNFSVLNIDPNHYDNNNVTLDDVPIGKWTIQIISLYPVTGYSGNDIQYGQKVYDTYDEALAGTKDIVVINPYNSYDLFRTYLIIQQGTIDITDETKAKFFNAGKLGLFGSGSSAVSSGGGSSNSYMPSGW